MRPLPSRLLVAASIPAVSALASRWLPLSVRDTQFCRPLGTRKPDDGLASSSLGARVADGVSAGVTPALGGIQSRARRPAPSAPLTSLRTRCRRRSRTRPGKGACLRGGRLLPEQSPGDDLALTFIRLDAPSL